jgi:hypothetical protein
MKFLKDLDYQNTNKCIEQLESYDFSKVNNNDNDKDNDNYNNEITIFHVFWNGLLDKKQFTSINSYIYSQNLENTVLWIWLDSVNDKSVIDKNIEAINSKYKNISNIKVKLYDSELEAINTLFKNYKFLSHNYYIKFRSDIARVIFLYKYGGIYFDLDMILLKDLSPLLHFEFCYTWSYLNKGNNGLLRLFKESDNSLNLMNKYLNTVSPFNLNGQSFFLGYNQYIFDEDINIVCLPSTMFDPVWMLFDKSEKCKYSKLHNLDDFFKNTDENIDSFFKNQIYAYHWHSRNKYDIEKNSYFDKFDNKFRNGITF